MPDPAFEKDCTIGSSIGACKIGFELEYSGFHFNSVLGCSLLDCSRVYNLSSNSSHGDLCSNAYLGSCYYDGVRYSIESFFK